MDVKTIMEGQQMKRIIACIAALTLSSLAQAEGEQFFLGYDAMNYSLMNERVTENEDKSKATTNKTGLTNGEAALNAQLWTPEYGVEFTYQTNSPAVKGYYAVMPNLYAMVGFGLNNTTNETTQTDKDGNDLADAKVTNTASGTNFDLGAMWRQIDESALIEAAGFVSIENSESEVAKVKNSKSEVALNLGGMYYAAVNPKLFVGAGAGFKYILSSEMKNTGAEENAKEVTTKVSGMDLNVTLASIRAVL